MKAFWKTYVAVGVLAGLASYAYFVESSKPAESEVKDKVFTLDQGEVEEIVLESPERETIRLVKKDDDWRLLAPQAVDADETEVESVLSTLENLTVDEVVVETGADPAEFGLASPRITVAARLAGATEPLKLLLGDKVPTGTGIYAKLPTEARIFTVASYVESSFDKQPFDLRDRDLLHLERDAVTTLRVVGGDARYVLVRGEADQWSFTEPVETQAGRWKVDGLLGSITGLRMDAVAAEETEDLEAYGLSQPSWVISVGGGDGESKTLEIGSEVGDGKYHARAADSRLVAVIPGSLVDELSKGMGELRAKRLLDVATYDVEGFDVVTPSRTAVYERAAKDDAEGLEAQKWNRTAPEPKELEASTVQDALFKVSGLEALEFIDDPEPLARYGLDAPALKLTLRFEAKPEQWIEIGRTEQAAFGRRLGDRAILKLDGDKVEEFVKAFAEL